jgi:hypothetical protein
VKYNKNEIDEKWVDLTGSGRIILKCALYF